MSELNEQLLPCPFCGGTEAFVERLNYSTAYVQCDSDVGDGCSCQARGPIAVQDDDGEEIPGGAGAIRNWNRRSPASPAPVAAITGLPPLPEMIGAADMGAALDTPEDWDADYRATWRNLQIADCNKRQWRAYALQLRAALAAVQAASPAVQPPANKTAGDRVYAMLASQGVHMGSAFVKELVAVAASTVPAAPAEPVAYLKEWSSVGNARQGMRKLDFTKESELWLANMFPTVTPLYAGQSPAQPARQANAGADAKDAARLDRLGGAIKMVVNMLSRDATPVRIEAAGTLMAAFGEVAEQHYNAARALTSADEVKPC